MLSAKLQLRQTQALVMTPQLMQSIRLLQLTHVELDKFVDEEIERNPLLERVDTRESEQPELAADTRGGEGDDWSDKAPEWTVLFLEALTDTTFLTDPSLSDPFAPAVAP